MPIIPRRNAESKRTEKLSVHVPAPIRAAFLAYAKYLGEEDTPGYLIEQFVEGTLLKDKTFAEWRLKNPDAETEVAARQKLRKPVERRPLAVATRA